MGGVENLSTVVDRKHVRKRRKPARAKQETNKLTNTPAIAREADDREKTQVTTPQVYAVDDDEEGQESVNKLNCKNSPFIPPFFHKSVTMSSKLQKIYGKTERFIKSRATEGEQKSKK